jgi:glycogen debranching enzyme
MKRRIRTDQTNTIDQHLLGEIRDQLVALPLAKELKHQDVETAKRLRRELDELHERVERQAAVQKLLSRAAGIDADALSDDELALLVELGAKS